MSDLPAINAALSELFAENVQIELLRQLQLADTSLFVAAMQYTKWNESGSPFTVKQTAVVIHSRQLDLPPFAVWPKQGGLVGLVHQMLGMRDICFGDSSGFSKTYHLSGWNEAAVRALFTRELRSSLEKQARWSARGSDDWIVLYQEQFVCKPVELDAFAQRALELFAVFQRGEESLDAKPELSRQVEMSDVVASLETRGGFGASAMKRHWRRIQVTPQELSLFLAQPTPRQDIPRGLRLQVIGDNFMLVVIGMLFLIVGPIVMLPVAIREKGELKLILTLMGAYCALVGGGMVFFTVWYRKVRKRLLSSGILTNGTLTDVISTGIEVNAAQRHSVYIDYSLNGKQLSTVMPLYVNVEKARELRSYGKPVRLLVDPADHSRVVCLDTLLVFD